MNALTIFLAALLLGALILLYVDTSRQTQAQITACGGVCEMELFAGDAR